MKTTSIVNILATITALLAFIASLGGLLWDNLYRDPADIRSAWLGNDIVTLLIVIPLLIVALYQIKNLSATRGRLLMAGIMGYMVYNYAFYLFGAAFNGFFLLYVAIFALSMYTLILTLINLDIQNIKNQFSEKLPITWISVFLLLISLPLAIIEISQIATFLNQEKDPGVLSLVFALDLAVVVPNTALAAILLWKRKNWGYVLGAIMLIKAFTYGLVLSVATAVIADFSMTGFWDPLMPFYLFVTVGGLLGSLTLFYHFQRQSKEILV